MSFLSTPIPAIPFIVIMVITFLYSNLFMDSGKANILNYRKNQAKKSSMNSFRVKFKEDVDKRVAFSKREKIEILCLNAGFDLSYSDYLLVCGGIAFLFFFLCVTLMNNFFMGIVLGAFGYNLPKQVLGIIRTKRIQKLENQIGPFMNMVVKRYEYTGDFEKAMINTAKDFYGTEPLFTELSKTVSEMSVGIPIPNALDNLARRTSNKYLGLLADYYKIAYSLGTDEVRKKLLNQAYIQFEENRKMKAFLKEQISEPIRDSYLMVMTVPVFFLFGCFAINGYTEFMFNETLGQVTLAIIAVFLLGIIWFINKVVGAPLDKRKEKQNNNPSQRK